MGKLQEKFKEATQGKCKKRLPAAFLLAAVLVAAGVSLSGGVQVAKASNVVTIPGTDLTKVRAARKLVLNSSTFSRCDFAPGVRGEVVTSGGLTRMKIYHAVDAGMQCDFTSPMTAYFTNVGTIAGRPVNVTIAVDSVNLRVINADYIGYDIAPGILQVDSTGAWVEINKPCVGTVRTTTTVTWADTGEVIQQPFYQLISDIDVQGTLPGEEFREGWEGISGYTGDLFIYGTNNLDVSGMRVQVKQAATEDEAYTFFTDGDDEILVSGVFAAVSGGVTSSMWYDGSDAGMYIDIFSPFQNLPQPQKSVS